MKKNQYPDFPIHPGDKVYFPGDASDVITAVGVTEEGNLVVLCRGGQ